jgi:hypothetical protein
MPSRCAKFEEREQWGESKADEASRHNVQGQEMSRLVQTPKDARFGKGRAMHRRPIAGFDARLEVIDHGQPCAQTGLFEKPKTYAAIVRLSNAAPTPTFDDRDMGFRGFAIKVQDADGNKQ